MPSTARYSSWSPSPATRTVNLRRTRDIFSLWSLAEFRDLVGEAAAQRAAQGSVMLEFQVADADAEYARLGRLQGEPIDFVLTPTTLPWGNRSIYFRDPDGNLVNFFTPPAS